MGSAKSQDSLRAIPPVDEILSRAVSSGRRRECPNFPWTQLIRSILHDYRKLEKPPPGVDAGRRDSVLGWIVTEVDRRFRELYSGGQVRVINGTGVILHTNLGRAVIGAGARAAVDEALGHYVSLEVDLETGKRSKRAETLNRLAALATGAEAAMVVNNNAAGVYLVVSSYSPPGRIIVSRGELVEIGGSFRLPEILRHAASEVIEVGTTNRTYARDYERVATPGDVLLKVHKSNYALEGFVSEASFTDLIRVAAEKGCYMVYDLGSGAVFDYRSAGVGDDAHVRTVLEAGVDCAMMSGDKLLGGVQAGLVVGKAAFFDKLRQNPLRRAVRIDKVTVAALQDVLRRYLFSEDPVPEVPVLDQVLSDLGKVRARAKAVAGAVSRGAAGGAAVVDVVEDESAVGGGSWASEAVPSAAVRIDCGQEGEAVKLAKQLRQQRPPVFSRVKGSEVRINFRTVQPHEDEELTEILKRVLAG